ncbi:ABC transporter substrate-binding protein [Actinokineospora auranticolor]|uniref:Peptide/nickel transport system substrate-binding protein n=1 Tax=Actinokineospora auranticolor TaxID=155976 RepID=A0A2S6GQR8_9PSEU|nr:ABC transporter substrate-binding protein [Actinokineospora auranticolor]PPK67582.1 peptide/nickel transport system substrate-binding protein [Actinokineospora auranticolor]
MPILPRRTGVVLCLVAVLGLALACTADPPPPASGDPAGTSLVIGVAQEPASLDPVRGYALNGAAKVFDGLVEHQPVGTLRPALATGLPVPSADGKSWTARLRTDVSYTDGSAFDSADVVAAYQRVIADSPLKARFWMLDGVKAVDQATVRFDLNTPCAYFPDLLVLGIPSAGTPDKLVGTGPYQVSDWQRGKRLVLTANKAYFGTRPAITTVTVEFIPDDEVRAQRLRDGKLDGTALPARLAADFAKTDGLAVVNHSSADLRAVTFAATGPTADPAVRLALNLAVDRQDLVEQVLAGKGKPASLPVPPTLAEFVEPGADIGYDPARAATVLDAAGWVAGADGIRAKAGERAAVAVGYRVADVTSRDLVAAFAATAKKVGVEVTANPTAEVDPATPHLVAFGDPFDPDPALHPLLHPAGGTIAANLDAARATTDPAQRAVAFRALERAYATAPTMVVLAAPDHSYVMRENWNGYQPVVDAAGTDYTWGPWWNLQAWTPN